MNGKPHHRLAVLFTIGLLLLGTVPGVIFHDARLPRNGIGFNIVALMHGEALIPIALAGGVIILVLSYFVSRWLLVRLPSPTAAAAASGASYALIAFASGIPLMISIALSRGLETLLLLSALRGLAVGAAYYGIGLALLALITPHLPARNR